MKKTGIFWAFGNQQFEENKTHKNASATDYISVGGGGYIHKSNINKLDNFFKEIVPRLKEELTSNIKIEDLIKYELVNHECYYTGDFTEILDIIHEYYDMPKEEIYKKIENVYNSTKEEKMDVFDICSDINI